MARDDLVIAITRALDALAGSRPAEGFLVRAVPGRSAYLIGTDPDGRTALVVPQDRAWADEPTWPALELANLRYLPSVRSQIREGANDISERDVAVVLIDAAGTDFENLLPALLAGVISAAGESPSSQQLGRAVRGLRDVFQSLTRDAIASYVGTWGELFVMATAADPALLAAAWGNDPNETFDFSVEGERLEVKTTLQASRRHHFSYNQLLASKNSVVLIASIQTALVPDGATARALLDDVLGKLTAQPQVAASVLQRTTAALGSDLMRQDAPSYDLALATESLALFPFSDVPAVVLDAGVLDVQWTAQLPTEPSHVVGSVLASGLLGFD